MKSKLQVFRFPILLIAAVVIVFGCTKIDTTTIGSGMLPVVDNVNTFDTVLDVSVKNYTDFASDSEFVIPARAHIVGHTDDPIFGKTDAAMYFQVSAVNYPFTFPVRADSLHFDSAVLVLKFAAAYGDTVAKHRFNVYPVTNDTFNVYKKLLSSTGKDSVAYRLAYRINQEIKYDQSQLLGTALTAPQDIRASRKLNNKKDSVVSSELRIRLNDVFGRSFFTDAIDAAYTNDTLFKQFFKGFAVVTDPSAGGNALMYFVSTGDTKLQLYHRVDKRDGTKDTTVQTFPYYAGDSRIANYIKRDRSTGEIAGHLDNNTPDNLMYLQGTPGTYARVTIPGIENVSNRIVHRAELVFKQIWTGPQKTEDDFIAPAYVYSEIFNTDSNKVIRVSPFDTLIYNPFLPNIYTSGYFSYVGGVYNAYVDASSHVAGAYNINLTRYVQAIITRHYKNYPLQLSLPYLPNRFVASDGLQNPLVPLGSGRLKAGAGNHPQYKMYLRIIYSKLK